MVYAYAAYVLIGVNINALADKVVYNDAEEPVKADKKVAKKPFVPKTGNGFVNSWR